jgi:hypothetical protein
MSMTQAERWGPLWIRDHDPDRPHKLLALDGGGIRGLITLGMLREMEKKLAERSGQGNAFRLGKWFDYIGGTSTGAIIAAGLARGMSIQELIQFYRDSGKAMFENAALLKRLVNFYEADPLRDKLREVFGAASTLEPQYLESLLLVVTHNVTTDSPWPISSNPDARYNDPARMDCNLRIPLWQLVRASTAAPVYFPPEVLHWDKTDPSKAFVFVDGGVTPYNNPAFLIYRMATAVPYRLNWKAGEKNLLVVSVGTGSAANPSFKSSTNLVANVAGLPGHLMYAISNEQDIACRTVGRCTHGPWIDRELFDMTCRDAAPHCDDESWLQASHKPFTEDLGRECLYARYNADLSRQGLDRMGFHQTRPEDVQKLDSVDHMDELLAVGTKAGEQVDVAHFGSFA